MQKVSLSFLSDYIKNGEVGYQVVDELVEIARGGEDKQTKFLLEEIDKSKEAVIIESHEDYIMGYEDIMEWSETTDILILLDSGVMLLLPKHIDVDYPTMSKILPICLFNDDFSVKNIVYSRIDRF